MNGEQAQPGRRVDATVDVIAVDGVRVAARNDLVYYLLNKPAGYVSTASDPEGRPTVVELVPDDPRVFPVGRLDYDTEGLLVLTNDGDLTQLLTHPRHGVAKTYLAEVDGVPTPGELRSLRTGVDLDDGPTAPATVTLVQERGVGRGDRAHDPRRPQPSGPAHVRGNRAPGGPSRAHADRAARGLAPAAGGVAVADAPGSARALRSRDRRCSEIR